MASRLAELALLSYNLLSKASNINSIATCSYQCFLIEKLCIVVNKPSDSHVTATYKANEQKAHHCGYDIVLHVLANCCNSTIHMYASPPTPAIFLV
jgi:hypothetical protein